MKKIKNLTIGLLLSLMGGATFAQNGLEGVFVEKYYVSNAADATGSVGTLPAGSVTYRVFADMLPGYKFQALYGVTSHALKINSSSTFFNNEDRGNTNPAIGASFIKNNSVAIDSWFSVGGAANGNMGILKSEDNGAANLITGNTMLSNVDPTAGIGLMTQDGIIAGTPVAVTFVGLTTELDVFNATSQVGSSFLTTNGSIAALGGSVGPVPATNKVLIGQFTTAGNFHFELNIQIGTPTGGTQNYVSSSPTGSEISIPSLVFSSNIAPAAPTVTSPVTYCQGVTATPLTATALYGCSLKWYTVPTGGTGSATAPTPSTATAGTTSYYVSQVNSIGVESTTRATINVVVNAAPSVSVNSPSISCGGTATLTASGATTYAWSAGATSTGVNTATAAPATTATYTVTGTSSGCTGTTVSTVTVTTTALTAPTTLTGTTSGLCPSGVASAVYTCGTVAGATTYTWTAPAGATVTAGAGTTTATISFGPTFTSGNISVTAGNSCGTSSAKILAVKSTLAAPTLVSTSTTGLCPSGVASATYTCGTVAGASSYLWAVPTGATITAGSGTTSVTISFGASFTSGNITVAAVNACGTGLVKTLAVKSTLAAPTLTSTSISGLCPSGVSSAVYTCGTVAGASSYLWTVPTGATITAGSGTTSVTVSFGGSFTSGNITVAAVNACGTGLVKTLAVKSTLAAPTLTSTFTTGLCPSGVASAVYTCGTVAGASSYLWTVPTGASITAGAGTTSVTVSFSGSFTSGNITVAAVNACGTGLVKTLAVKSTLAAPTLTSTSTTGLCPSGVSSAVYTCGTVVGATSYNWTVPTGATITAGAGTTSVTVSFGASFTSGNITVIAVNACGLSPAKTLALHSSLLAPTTLTGPTTGICPAGITSGVYTCGTVVGATSYNWTVPTGATITAGAGTSSITVSYAPTFTSGSITVNAQNACGSGAAKMLAVRSTLLAPGVVTGSTVVCANATDMNYSILPVAGATSYVWTVPSGATITSGAGTNAIVVDFGATASGGITVKAINDCGNGLARSLVLSMTCMGTYSGNDKALANDATENTVDLYPNPTSENLNIKLVSDVDKDVVIEIFNALGSRVSSDKYSVIAGENMFNTNVSNYVNGFYFVHITDLSTNATQNKTFIKQ